MKSDPDALVRPIGATPEAALAKAAAVGGYLRRLQGGDRLGRLLEAGPESLASGAIEAARAAADPARVDVLLRRAKADLHLACAALDLAGAWSLEQVTGALSVFADAAIATALQAVSLRLEGGPPPPGLFILAMGKLGAHELNYSSDVDLTVFYDAERLGAEAKRRAARLTQALAQLLEERTAEGYVFRVDLRLRPDPGSTPAAVSIGFAETYYQSLGQNWERAAFIKARPVAGDLQAAESFLAGLESFRWRRHLDFAAIADIRSIKRQLSGPADEEALHSGVFDVKRDRGGIRDIELFAQT
ncbi:MAG: glutamine-synthetase adenylyltransferase, partial [Hyphomonadaceae bacterium]|nr:glutamine-synthetase adenylyltransferase [Hyphomonadaceae bacterium]